jgi:hypothetical protein
LLEDGVLIFPKPEGGCVVFSASELSCIDTSADSAQALTLVWLRGASQPIAVARTGDEVLDHYVRASAARQGAPGGTRTPAAARGGPVDIAALAGMSDDAFDAYVTKNGIDLRALLGN